LRNALVRACFTKLRDGPGSWRRLGRRAGCACAALVRGCAGGRPQPQRHAGRLHRLLHHRQQLGGQGVQVDLLAQPGAEPLNGPGGVVAAPVEAPVDRLLDAAAGRLEQSGHRQGSAGHHQAGLAAAEQLAEPEDHSGVPAAQQHGEQLGGRGDEPAGDRRV
jgi:hypothetical protein